LKVGVGGTFNTVHRGHRAILDKAFQVADFVVVGITSDEMAKGRKEIVVPLEERRSRLEAYLRTRGENWSVTVIDRPAGRVDEYTDITALIISPETRPSAEGINRERVAKGFNPLHLIVVPHILAEDFLPISARRIMAGEIDEEGHLLRPLKANVGSENRLKIDAAGNVLARFFDEVVVKGVAVRSSVPEQPREEETRRGAMERARLALEDGDLGIGLEAGVFDTEDGLYDIQYCAIIDRRGRYTIGQGSGFRYPPEIAEKVKEGVPVGTAFRQLYGWEKDEKKLGAIGFLTNGALGRTELAEQAVMAAMVPRIRRDIYPDL
jgi:inosine/xanthosine triphosphatase